MAHGFTSIPGGPSRGAYRHDKFERGRKELAQEIQPHQNRVSNSNTTGERSLKKSSSSEPNILLTATSTTGSAATSSFLATTTTGPSTTTIPPLSPHFWKAVLDSQPSSCSPTSSNSFVPIDSSCLHPPPLLSDEQQAVPVPVPQILLLDDTRIYNDWSSEQGRLTTDEHLHFSTTIPSRIALPVARPFSVTIPPPPPPQQQQQQQQVEEQDFRSCFLLAPDEPFHLSSISVMNNNNNRHNCNNNKRVADSMSFSLFSMELDEILFEDSSSRGGSQQNQQHQHFVSHQDAWTTSHDESIFSGSWRERLLPMEHSCSSSKE